MNQSLALAVTAGSSVAAYLFVRSWANTNAPVRTQHSQQDDEAQPLEEYFASKELNLNELFENIRVLLDVNRPERPLGFLGEQLRLMSAQSSKETFKCVFVLGGPGSGKGTQCDMLKKAFKNIAHFSAGDICRDMAKQETEQGLYIRHLVQTGQLIPSDTMTSLIRQAMMQYHDPENTTFILDGFPRNMEMALLFEKIVGPCFFVLHFECPEDVLIKRMSDRNREDDTPQAIKRRIASYNNATKNVLEYYTLQGKVRTIDTSKDIQSIFQEISPLFQK
jgi:UMP-CMP kinase